MSIVSGIAGASATKSAASTSASATKESTKLSIQSTEKLFNQAVKALQPYIDAGYRGLAAFETTPSGADVSELPSTTIDFEFDPEDQIYKTQQEEGEKAINRALAARGLYSSRAGVNALADFNRKLIADETQNQYSRALAKYGRDIDRFGTVNALAQQELNKYYSLANLGRGTATSQGSLGTQAAGNISGAYLNQGNALANIYGNQGNALANIYGNIAPNTIGSAYYGVKAYNAYNANQPSYNYGNAAAGYNAMAGGYGGMAGGGINANYASVL